MVSIVCGCASGSGGSHSSSSVFQKSITITKLPSSLSLSLSISITNTKGSPSSLFLTTRPLQPRGLTLAKMAQSCSSPKQEEEHRHSVVQLEKVTVKNNYGENLAGLLHETGSVELVILCHGFRSSKDNTTMINLAEALTKEGLSVFRFDFAGNGESEGSFQYGNYLREADDLRSVVSHFSGGKHAIITILGHSKGGNVVLLYASRYGDVPTVINVSGRYNLKNGIEERIGKDFMQNIKRDGFIDVTSRKGVMAEYELHCSFLPVEQYDDLGEVQYRITEESLMERLGTDMHTACLSIDNGCRVLTVHGSSDEVIPVEDAFEFSKIIPNHKLHIIEGADHGYSKHQVELAEVVSNFIKASLQQGKDVVNLNG